MKATHVFRLAALGLLLYALCGCKPLCEDCGWNPNELPYTAEISLESDTANFAVGDSVFVDGWVAIRDDSGRGVPDQRVYISLEHGGGWIEYPDPVWQNVSNDSGLVPFRYHALVTVCQVRQWLTASSDEVRWDPRSVAMVAMMVRAEVGTADFDSVAVTIIPDTLYELPPENTFRPRVEMRLYRNGLPAAAGLECVGFRVPLMPSWGDFPWSDFTVTDNAGMAYTYWQLPHAPGLYCLTYSMTGDTAACAVILPGRRP